MPDQPLDAQARQGALNRLNYIRLQKPEADFWISQEGGLHTEDKRLFSRAWIAVTDKLGKIYESSTSQFYLPNKMTEDVKKGLELGQATDNFFESKNTKHGLGAIGYLTDGIIDRTNYYLQPAIIALSELKHHDWYD